jgi:hypothetical protein
MFEYMNVLYGGQDQEACPDLKNPSRRSQLQLLMPIIACFRQLSAYFSVFGRDRNFFLIQIFSESGSKNS